MPVPVPTEAPTFTLVPTPVPSEEHCPPPVAASCLADPFQASHWEPTSDADDGALDWYDCSKTLDGRLRKETGWWAPPHHVTDKWLAYDLGRVARVGELCIRWGEYLNADDVHETYGAASVSLETSTDGGFTWLAEASYNASDGLMDPKQDPAGSLEAAGCPRGNRGSRRRRGHDVDKAAELPQKSFGRTLPRGVDVDRGASTIPRRSQRRRGVDDSAS